MQHEQFHSNWNAPFLAQNVNIGEADTIVIPEEFSEEDRITGKWWRQLVAGGGAGAGEEWRWGR